MEKFIRKILVLLLDFYTTLLAYTLIWRGRFILPRGNFIWVFWHNRILYFIAFYKRYLHPLPFAALVSPSRDGEIIAKVAERGGMKIVRGSSRHFSPSTARKIFDFLKEGYHLVMIPDGPRGPRYEVKEGVFRISSWTKLWILPLSFDSSFYLVFPSWDFFRIPLPFSRVNFQLGVLLPPGEDRKEELKKRLPPL